MSEIVLGLQSTVDYEVRLDRGTLESLAAEWGVGVADLDAHRPIDDERSLLAVLLAHLRDGVGGERFAASSAIVEAFSLRFPREITLGGTPLRAALAMRALGVPALLHLVSTDPHARRLIPADVRSITSATGDTLDPHLILQWAAGDAVRVDGVELVAPHPNRLIVTNDPPARELVLSAELGRELDDCRVFLVSGLNSIQEPERLEARIGELRTLLERMPEGSLTLFEDAGYHRDGFRERVRAGLLPAVDVASMNEDELQEVVDRRVDLLDAADVADAVERLLAEAPGVTHVVHSKYWTLALGPRAAELRAALRGGIVMASTRYLHGDLLSAERYAAVAALPPNPASAAVVAGLAERLGARAVVEPGLLLDTEHPTTIGLGDTFVGGFIAALAPGAAARPEHAA